MSHQSGIAHTLVQWGKFFGVFVAGLVVTVLLADFLSGDGHIGGVGLPLLILFVLGSRVYAEYLGIV